MGVRCEMTMSGVIAGMGYLLIGNVIGYELNGMNGGRYGA
jgi:hypothetical protein